jgi:hypothetical protein
MMNKAILATVVLALSSVTLGAGCASEVSDADGADITVGGDDGSIGESANELIQGCKISRAQIYAGVNSERDRAIKRGFSWYDRNVPYSQTRSFEGYRTDCSGFISMAWELGRSFSTADFIAGGGESGPLSSYNSLVGGDALVRRANGKGHIVMFLGWNDAAKTSACVVEQASTATDMEFGTRTTASMKAAGYRAIRGDKF